MKEKTKVKIVNLITGSRILGSILLPFIASVLGPLGVAIYIGVLWATDALDGYLAKHKWEVSTIFGANLDPFSDKLFGIAVLSYLIPIFPALIIPVLSEIFIFMVNWRYGKKGADVKSSKLGKVKTAILDGTTVLALLSTLSLTNLLVPIIPILISITTSFQIGTLINYTYKHKKYLKNNKPKNNVSHLSLWKTLKEIGKILKNEKIYSPSYFKEHKNEPLLDILLSKDEKKDEYNNISEIKTNNDIENRNKLKIKYNLNDKEIDKLEQFAKTNQMSLEQVLEYLKQYSDYEKVENFEKVDEFDSELSKIKK